MTGPSPFLSIVTISFNQKQFLRQAVESVLCQKADDVEYIVVDPGSSDGSRQLLQGYAGRIDHLVFEPDNGPADGLNKGFARAAGRVGYFINSDDFLLPGAVDRLRSLWRSNAGHEVIAGAAWMIDGAGLPLYEAHPLPINLAALIWNRTIIVQHGYSFSMAAFAAVGGFNPANRTCWDYELMCEIAARGGSAGLSAARIGAFRLHGEGLSGGVAGAAHDARYRADTARIFARFAGRGPKAADHWWLRLGSLSKYALNPAWAMRVLANHCLPKRMAKRYERDLGNQAPSRQS